MKSAAQHNPSQSFGLLLLGRPGSGKTTIACQFPRPYILDCDNNLNGALRHLKTSFDLSKISYDTVNVDNTNKEVPPFKRFNLSMDLLTVAIQSDKIETIIIDSITSFHDYIVDEVRRQQCLQPGVNLRIQDWGSVAFLWKNTITRLRSTGLKIIFIGHTKLEKNEFDGSIFQQVLIQGQMKDQIAVYFSDVWLCQCEDKLENSKRIGVYTIRVLQNQFFLDLKNSLDLPSIFPSDPKVFLPKLNEFSESLTKVS